MTSTQLFHWTILGLLAGQAATLIYAFYPAFKPRNRCIAGVVCVITMISLLRLISTSTEISWMPPAILVLVIPLGFLIGPLFYLYVSYDAVPEFRARPIHLLLSIPFFASWLLILSGPLDASHLQSFFSDTILGERWWHCLFMIVQGFCYLIFQEGLLKKWKLEIVASGRPLNETNFPLIRLLSNLFYVIMIVSAINMFGFTSRSELWIWGTLGLFTMGVTGYALRVSHAWKDDKLTVGTAAVGEAPPDTRDKEGRYKTSNLDQDAITKIQATLITHVETSNCFLQSNLSLAQLANRIKVPSHHLSQALNIGMGKNFYDFINDYRVEHAKRELIKPENNSRPILDIAYECGFNSKSVFNAAFKKRTGLTPSSFREKPAESASTTPVTDA